MKRWLAALALLPLLASCGNGLQEEDPAGFDACSAADKVDTDSKSVEDALGSNSDIADLARKSDTASIRDTAEPLVEGEPGVLGETYLVDLDDLLEACDEAGFELGN